MGVFCFNGNMSVCVLSLFLILLWQIIYIYKYTLKYKYFFKGFIYIIYTDSQ